MSLKDAPFLFDRVKKLPAERVEPKVRRAAVPVLLTHGTFSNGNVCTRLAAYLATHGFPCWVLELRGHGASDAGEAALATVGEFLSIGATASAVVTAAGSAGFTAELLILPPIFSGFAVWPGTIVLALAFAGADSAPDAEAGSIFIAAFNSGGWSRSRSLSFKVVRR